MNDAATDNETRVIQLIGNLIQKLELHEADKNHRSLGHLKHLIQALQDTQAKKQFRDPLFFVNTPRWLGEWGNTPLEEEIYSIACEINQLVVDICGGQDKVYTARNEHNQQVIQQNEKL